MCAAAHHTWYKGLNVGANEKMQRVNLQMCRGTGFFRWPWILIIRRWFGGFMFVMEVVRFVYIYVYIYWSVHIYAHTHTRKQYSIYIYCLAPTYFCWSSCLAPLFWYYSSWATMASSSAMSSLFKVLSHCSRCCWCCLWLNCHSSRRRARLALPIMICNGSYIPTRCTPRIPVPHGLYCHSMLALWARPLLLPSRLSHPSCIMPPRPSWMMAPFRMSLTTSLSGPVPSPPVLLWLALYYLTLLTRWYDSYWSRCWWWPCCWERLPWSLHARSLATFLHFWWFWCPCHRAQ